MLASGGRESGEGLIEHHDLISRGADKVFKKVLPRWLQPPRYGEDGGV